jgi:hypothetical protein
LTLTTTWPISVLPFEQLPELGERGIDPPGDYRGNRLHSLVLGVFAFGGALRDAGSRFEPRDSLLEPRDRVVEFAHRLSLGTGGPERQRSHPYVTFSYFCSERI